VSTSDSLNTGVLEILWNAGPIAKVVLGVLLLFSIVSWALIVEKWWQFRRVRRQTLGFVKIFREGRRPSLVQSAARKYRDSPLAQLYAAAYAEISGVPDVIDHVIDEGDEGLPAERLDAVHRAMRRAAGLEVAQFIGLFGTVWGIMSAFHGIGTQGSASLAVVAPGISEALIATAAGLAAAIPAVIGYNYFINRVRHWATEMDGFMLDLLNVLSRPMSKLGRSAKDGV